MNISDDIEAHPLIIEANEKHESVVKNFMLKLDLYVKDKTKDPYLEGLNNSEHQLSAYNLNSYFSSPEKKIFLAKIKKKYVGIVCGKIAKCFLSTSTKKIGYIEQAFVEEEYRNFGIMTSLQSMLGKFFIDNQVSFMEVSSHIKMLDSSRYWQEKGFEPFKMVFRKKIQ